MNQNILSGKKMLVCFILLGQCYAVHQFVTQGAGFSISFRLPPNPSKCIFGIVSSCSQTPKPLEPWDRLSSQP